MDKVTTKMCDTGVGRIGFAKVLVEIDVEMGIKDKTEIMYKSKNIAIGTKKIVDVEYSWENGNYFKVVHNKRYGREGFMMNRRTDIQNGQKGKMWNEGRFGNVNNKWQQNNKFEYRMSRENEGKEKDVNGGTNKDSGTNVMSTNNEKASDGKKEKNDNQKVHQEGSTSMESSNGGGILRSNRFTLLDSLVNEEELVPNTDQRKIVDEFLCKKNDVNNMEMNGWSEDMKRYYRDKKELFDAAREIEENEDVLDENYGVENNVLRNEVKGVGLCSYSDKQKEVKKLIHEEGLHLCVILETHVKYKNIKKTCETVFGDWEYITNGEDNNKGCRIMIGWNDRKIQAWLISQSRQYIFLMVETIDKKSKFFCIVIYASNSGMERRKLWKDLEIQKIITCGMPWVILGDFNVTLKVFEHSNGSANLSSGVALDFQVNVKVVKLGCVVLKDCRTIMDQNKF
ncbi:RNA-directed DNA polymerase, eukaryota, reverse transcriptase zinc-binding domain protein [Tanacetum coccineum]|uniref:RNA-directed DNA polymerase, eukaryota, reverse transcriptase zinc-binding domain protein n=1 Tax=Tanacetum coccineum TaxID=301880 RepID=A0ABQ5EC90_9ASTR